MSNPWPADKVERWPIARLVPSARNARTHSETQISQVAASIREWGWTTPVLVDEAGTLIAGHARTLAAQKLGITEVPVMVAVGWTEAQKRAYTIADNKLAINADWNKDLLRVEFGDLKMDGFNLDLMGFSGLEMADLLAERNAGLTDPDDVPEAPTEPVSRLGDVWIMGRHRLACGDATLIDVAASVMDGCLADYVFTSPPYGIGLSYEKGDSLETLIKLISDAVATIHTVTSPVAYATINYADIFRPGDAGFTPMSEYYHKPFAKAGWCLRGNRIWFKPFARLALAYGTSTTMNLREWEYVQTWRRGRGREMLREHGISLRGVWKSFGDDAVISDWKQHDATTSKDMHPAAFPVLLPVAGIRCYTDPEGIVLEPFSGSGTTIVACEMTGRVCRAIEVLPSYVDVAVTRWQNFSGQTAKLESDGRSFAEVAAERKEMAQEPAVS